MRKRRNIGVILILVIILTLTTNINVLAYDWCPFCTVYTVESYCSGVESFTYPTSHLIYDVTYQEWKGCGFDLIYYVTDKMCAYCDYTASSNHAEEEENHEFDPIHNGNICQLEE